MDQNQPEVPEVPEVPKVILDADFILAKLKWAGQIYVNVGKWSLIAVIILLSLQAGVRYASCPSDASRPSDQNIPCDNSLQMVIGKVALIPGSFIVVPPFLAYNIFVRGTMELIKFAFYLVVHLLEQLGVYGTNLMNCIGEFISEVFPVSSRIAKLIYHVLKWIVCWPFQIAFYCMSLIVNDFLFQMIICPIWKLIVQDFLLVIVVAWWKGLVDSLPTLEAIWIR